MCEAMCDVALQRLVRKERGRGRAWKETRTRRDRVVREGDARQKAKRYRKDRKKRKERKRRKKEDRERTAREENKRGNTERRERGAKG